MDRKQWRYGFGERLRIAREAKGMSQGVLGLWLGVHGHTVSEYERGLHEPTAYMLTKMARVLDVSADDLLGVK